MLITEYIVQKSLATFDMKYKVIILTLFLPASDAEAIVNGMVTIPVIMSLIARFADSRFAAPECRNVFLKYSKMTVAFSIAIKIARINKNVW